MNGKPTHIYYIVKEKYYESNRGKKFFFEIITVEKMAVETIKTKK